MEWVEEKPPAPLRRGLPHSHCHDLHDGLIEALAEADQGGPAVTHTAQHDACGGQGHSISQTPQTVADVHDAYVCQHRLVARQGQTTGTRRSRRLADCPAASDAPALPSHRPSPPRWSRLWPPHRALISSSSVAPLYPAASIPCSKDRNAPCQHPRPASLHTQHNQHSHTLRFRPHLIRPRLQLPPPSGPAFPSSLCSCVAAFFTFLDYIKLLTVMGPLPAWYPMPEALAWLETHSHCPGRLPTYSPLFHFFLIPSYHLLQQSSGVFFCLLQ